MGRRLGLLYDGGECLQLKKRQAALLASLFIIGAVCVGGYFVYDYNTSDHASRLTAGQVQEINAALAENAAGLGVLGDGQMVTVSKLYRKLGGDTTVEFTVYQTSEATDRAAAASYLDKNAKKDETLTAVATGNAVLEQDSVQSVTALTIVPD